ncbi:MAG: DUF3150 domain-containing protein, partial [Methylococcaceae bacterium]
DGLSFLDYRVAPVVQTIDELLNRIPGKGAIEGGILQEILATALLLADPDKMRRHGSGLLTIQSLVNDEIDIDQPHSLHGHPTVPPLNPFSGLFDGILDDDLVDDPVDADDDSDQGEIDVVTTEDGDNNEEDSDPDFWF